MNARDTAPRGKLYAVVRMDHRFGDRILPILVPCGRYLTRSAAEAAASELDKSFGACVVLVDASPPVEVYDERA